MKYVQFGSIAVIAAALLWSLDALLRIKLYSLPAPVIVFWEHLFGLALLLPIAATSFKAFKKLTKRQWQAIIGVSFLSGAAGTILYTAALSRVQFAPFSVVILLQQLNLIFAITAAAVFLKEPVTRRFVGLAAVAFAAAYLVSFPNLSVNLSTGNGTLMAAVMAIGAAAAWGTSTAFSKYALKGTSSLHIATARFGFTPIFALLFVVLSGSTASLGAITFDQFKYIIAITFSTGLLALLIYYFGLKRIPASRSAILELTWPLSALVIDYFYRDKTLTLTQLAGAALLTGAIYLIARDSHRQSALESETEGRLSETS